MGKSIIYVYDHAFDGCTNIGTVFSLSTIPPGIGVDAFKNVPTNANLFVPCETKSLYEISSWNSFTNIYGLGCPATINVFKNRSFQDLSGGQQQRVLLARALCATEKLILLDEPVTGLDPLVTAEMYAIIKELNEKHGITVIMISHDIQGAIDAASHVLHLHHKPLFFGKKEDYLLADVGKDFLGGEAK